MKTDTFGRVYVTENDIVESLYRDPTLDIFNFLVEDPKEFNNSVTSLHIKYPILKTYIPSTDDVTEFDKLRTNDWFMPDEYRKLDIVKWLLDQCTNDAEVQRVGQELLMYAERNLIEMLKYFKYLVDTMRQHNVVWGVGRGSSVASYVLFIIGVHKIDSLYYNIPIEEFLK